jgi:DNA repair protein RadC
MDTIGYAKISQGGVSGTHVDTKIIAKYALDSLCTNLILCHNHPSGFLKPSRQDLEMTEEITKGLKYLDIEVTDHIIITEEEFYSFREEGLIVDKQN